MIYLPLIQSYALWNNKGGVGKSTITYHLAMRYAETNPDKNVLVIDLCPQANSSMMLLGGGTSGEDNVVSFCSSVTPKSVVGYLSTVIANGRGAKLPDPDDFMVKVSDYNSNSTTNLYLLCGDGNLEPMAPAINEAASARALTSTSQPWKWVQLTIKNFIDSMTSLSEKDWMIFVDTNPSFSIYTQIAISAVNRVLVPINADDSSKTAASAMFSLLHGTTPPHPIYGSWTFAETAKNQGVDIPKVHLLIGNRLTQFEGPATAFGALSNATAKELNAIYVKSPDYFVPRTTKISSLGDFINNYSVPLRDFNTAGVVCAHLGRRLSTIKQGYYEVYGVEVKVNADKIQECLKAIDSVVSRL